VQPGDVSRTLIQQGGGRGWGRTPAARRRGVDGETRSPGRASPSTGREEEKEGQGCAEGEGKVCLKTAQTSTIYRGRGRGAAVTTKMRSFPIWGSKPRIGKKRI